MNDTVVIAGAGPSGLMLACELGLAGVRAVIVERRDEPAESPGVAINVASVELLEQRGLLEPLKASAPTAPLPRAHFALIPLGVDRLPERYENSLIVTQRAIERVLEERAVALGAAVLRGHEVTGAVQDADGVDVTVRAASGEQRLRAAYLVGCDGTDSAVRRLAGIGFPGRESPFYGLVGDIEVPLAELAPAHLGAYYSDGGVYMCLPVGPGLVRLITAELGRDGGDLDAPVGWQETRETVLRLTGAPLESGRQRWMSRYRDRAAQADRYREGRIFVAGDAAHTLFPLNGQAINTALYDAVNLGWKLAAAVAGRAPEGLLDTYHSERHPVGELVLTNIEAQLSLSQQPEQVAPLREMLTRLIALDDTNRYVTDLVMGLDIRYPVDAADTGSGHPLLGRALPAVPLKTAGGETGAAELLGSGRGILLDLSGGAAPAGEAARWADRVDVVAAAPSPEIDAKALLVRPDGHVVWVSPAAGGGAEEDGLRAALERWFGAPTG